MLRRAIWVLALACSPADGEVLLARDGGAVIPSCDEAFGRGLEGDLCSFTLPCERASSSCCARRALCESGRLFFSSECTCDCTDDLDCSWGELCVGGDCRTCPTLDGCAPCPDGLASLSRHGCRTCACGPRHECSTNADCETGRVCIASFACVPGCDRVDCCAGICATEEEGVECMIPPLGCRPDRCDPGGECHFAAPCACEPSGWQCEVAEGSTSVREPCSTL
jgi:hypothetical protein